MNKFDEWISWFVPGSAYSGPERLRFHRLFINSCFVTALFALGYCLMSIYMSGYYFAAAMVISIVVFLILPFLLKSGTDLIILANVYTGFIAAVYICLVYWDGGIRTANVAPWIIMLPAMAMMMQGIRASVAWLVIALIIVAGFSYFNFQGIRFAVRFDTSRDPVFNLLSLSGLVAIISLIIFISENGKRKAQKMLEEQNRALERLNEEKNSFLNIVAHELKNPLASVRAFAEISANDKTTAEKRVIYLQHIAVSADRMFELIKNLLDVNMIESGKMGLKPIDLCLNDLIRNYLLQAELVAMAKQIILVAQLPDNRIYMKTDKARLEQILENFISNGMKYSPAGSKVYVELCDNPAYIEICVKDEGPGIAAGELDKLFKQYGVASSVPRDGEDSMGLGLAIVKKISDAFGAEVGCASEKGKGCNFYIRFPKYV
jgi:signal transduction histidine kinase